jgi:predicted PurR-regulated permease PerM
VLIIAQQITLQIIAPRVFGSTMGVHPLLLFAGLLIGAKIGGVWGAFFAGPAVAIAYSMFEVFYDRYQRSSPHFPNKPPLPPADKDERDAPQPAEATAATRD